MKRRFSTITFCVCLLTLSGCEADTAVEPGVVSPEVPGTQPLPTFELLPDRNVVGQGEEFQLFIVVRNTRGFSPGLPVITYSTNSPSTASVTPTGFVTALAPGTATLSATTIFAGITLQDSVRITVVAPTIYRELVLRAKPDGWQPTPAHVEAGGTVEWQGGTIAGAGVPVNMVYLMDSGYSIVDSVDLRSGSAKRIFHTRGAVRYCSNACWDPPEHGIFYVH